MTETTTALTPQGAHLVGSINFDDAETVFRAAAEHLGPLLRRIPDGEVGERFHWIVFQADRVGAAAGIERVGDQPYIQRGIDFRPVRIADGVNAADIELPSLGYADAALESWAIFVKLQDEGVIPAGTRFQVSLPTPIGFVAALVAAEDRAAFEPVYEAALSAELARIVAAIPHDRLAVQWDAALEFAILEAGDGAAESPAWFDDVWTATSERAARQLDRVPADVETGIHLCYGDVGEKHFVEPKDTENLVRFANLVREATQRHIEWVHLPVPIEREDDAYFTPLAELQLAEETELYLGLVHRQDGAEGAKRRIETAQRHVTSFGVATECGFGRAPEGTTTALFEAHRAIATPR